jgi:hypothetical protein
MAKDIINPRISLSLVMESANAMSKVDPKAIPQSAPQMTRAHRKPTPHHFESHPLRIDP